MKILLATGIWPPDIGGPATYSNTIAEEFAARGYDVVVVTYGDELKVKSQKLKVDFKIRVVSRKIPKGIRHLLYFWKVFRNGKNVDIIYAQDPVSAGLPALLAAKILCKKFVLKVVGDYAWEQAVQRFGVRELLDDFLKKKYGIRVERLRKIQSWAARGARLVIVPSLYLENVVKTWDVATPIKIIPNGIDASASRTSKSEVRKILGLDRNAKVLLSVGRLVPWKGFDMLLRLMPEFPMARLVIVGDGPERQRLETLGKRLKLENSLVFKGRIPRDALYLYMSAADIFLLNTAYEGHSHQLLEAMSQGLPVITTDAGGNKELLQNGENGLVAGYNKKDDWKSAIERLLSDEELAAKLSAKGREYALRFSNDRMIESTLKALTSL